MVKNIIVTGANGYIGKILCKHLNGVGYHKVVGIDNTKPHEELEKYLETYIQADINDDRYKLLQKIECLSFDLEQTSFVHLAAVASVPAAKDDPALAWKTNVYGTINMYALAHELKCKNFINADSAMSQFGDSLSVYADTKDKAKSLLSCVVNTTPIINLRFFNVCGAEYPDFEFGEDHNPETHFIPGLVNAYMHNQLFRLDSRNPSRDFVHVLDVCRAIEKAMNTDAAQMYVTEYDVGTSDPASLFVVADEARTLANLIGKDLKTIESKMPDRPEPSSLMIADPERFVPGWQPLYTWHDALRHQNNFVVASIQNKMML
jgi:nucleoside-diphosphate-sugar epimerase